MRRLLSWAARKVEDVYGWRNFHFGPPTAEYIATVMVRTDVQWRQIAASVRWSSDESARDVTALLGPLGVNVLVGRRRILPERPEGRAWSWALRVGSRDLHIYLNWRHLGVTAGWCRLGNRTAGRLEVGPVGFVAEPVL